MKNKTKLVDRLVKIAVVNKEKKKEIEQRQQTARKNQEILSNMIKEVNSIQQKDTKTYMDT